jgi:hypothetical protein
MPVTSIGPSNASDGFPIPEPYLSYDTAGKSVCYGDSGGPAFFVDDDGVEYVAGAASWVGDDFCSSYGGHARLDQPTIDAWLQERIDFLESSDRCRSDGHCDESCNTHREVLDPDCHAAHCRADGLCSFACVNPPDPDCNNIVVDLCGDDGICNPACTKADPDRGDVANTTSTSTGLPGSGGWEAGDGGDGGSAGDAVMNAMNDPLTVAGGCGVPGRSDGAPNAEGREGLIAMILGLVGLAVARRRGARDRRGGFA